MQSSYSTFIFICLLRSLLYWGLCCFLTFFNILNSWRYIKNVYICTITKTNK